VNLEGCLPSKEEIWSINVRSIGKEQNYFRGNGKKKNAPEELPRGRGSDLAKINVAGGEKGTYDMKRPKGCV